MDAAERRTEGMRREEQHPLRQLAVFRLLTDEEAAGLIAVAQRHSYARGAPVMDHPGTISVVAHGGVRFYCLSPAGRALTILTMQAGEFYEFGVLDPGVRPLGCAEALSDDTLIYSFPGTQALHLITSHPQLALLALVSLRRHLAAAYAQVRSLALEDVPTRLAQALWRLAATHPQRRVELTHQQLAELIGTTREEVTSALHLLRARRLISSQPHQRGIEVLPSDVWALVDALWCQARQEHAHPVQDCPRVPQDQQNRAMYVCIHLWRDRWVYSRCKGSRREAERGRPCTGGSAHGVWPG